MLFNSYEFLFFFLPVTFTLYRVACAKRATQAALSVLLISSLCFYSYWNPPFILLLLFSIAFNFLFGRIIEREYLTTVAEGGGNKLKLIIGIAVNLLLIIYFKYSNFLISNVAWLVGRAFEPKDIFLPLGISFFTFQQIAYLIDCSKGKTKGHSFLQYALFVSFFPQLIAGPIVRYEDIIPQFQNKRIFGLSWRNICIGMALLSLGLFKKVVIADALSPWVAEGFDNNDPLTFIEAWAAALSYTFQIYFDFSGYSDMAMGLGKFFNIDIPINFNSPYKATSMIDFWRRWHITLSQFLRDYVYIPLGGNRKGEARRYINLTLTMLIGGLWHGAAWQFVFWGFLHGFYLCINNLWRKLNFALPKVIGWGITFLSVVFAWVFFRANSFSRALSIIAGMLGMNGVSLTANYLPIEVCKNIFEKLGGKLIVIGLNAETWHFEGNSEIISLIILTIFVIMLNNSKEWTEKKLHLKLRFSNFYEALYFSSVVAIIFAYSILMLERATEFLYFQF